MTRDMPERIWQKISPEPNTGCWFWVASRRKDGYAQVYYAGQARLAHRIIYTLLVGNIPEALDLDHICHNGAECAGGPNCHHRSCVNPLHLEPVTRKVNTLRGKGITALRAVITQCPTGHAYDTENTLHCVDGKRYCRSCNRSKHHKRKGRVAA